MQADISLIKLTSALESASYEEAESYFLTLNDPLQLLHFAIWSMENAFPDYALRAFESSAELSSDPAILLDWTNALLYLCKYEQALKLAHRCVQEISQAPNSWMLLALAYERTHDLEQSLRMFEKALALSPFEPLLRYNYGCTLLLKGDFKQGWPEHEWRLKAFPDHHVYQGIPYWAGQHRRGKGLLVYTEQGFGDTLQFCRFLHLIDKSEGPVHLICQPELASLMAFNFPDVHIVGEGDEMQIAWQVSLMSLPAVFSLNENQFAPPGPYLKAPAPVSKQSESPRMGLVWSSGRHEGMAAYAHRAKSIPLERIVASLRTDFDYVSFQTGVEADEVQGVGLPILAPNRPVQSFTDTANELAAMNMVLSADTATAHLAGAMGIRTRVFIPFAPNWRWQLKRNNTPWYPGMRLLRQEQPMDWSKPLEELKQELSAL